MIGCNTYTLLDYSYIYVSEPIYLPLCMQYDLETKYLGSLFTKIPYIFYIWYGLLISWVQKHR